MELAGQFHSDAATARIKAFARRHGGTLVQLDGGHKVASGTVPAAPGVARIVSVTSLPAYPEALAVPNAGESIPSLKDSGFAGSVPSPARPRGPRIGRSARVESAAQVRGVLAERIVVSTELDPFFSLTALAGYSGMSVRKLRDFLTDAMCPLPHYRIGGKVIVRRSEYDSWAARFRRVGNHDVDRITEEIVKSLRS